MSVSGNEHAKKRLRSIKMKISQVDKIVPYLEKYVSVNRQAELQTISVLRESCTMELRQHGSTFDQIKGKQDSGLDEHTLFDTSSQGMPETSCSSQHSLIENPYATLSDVRNEAAKCGVKGRSNYAELNFPSSNKATARRPPSVNYVEVQIFSGPTGTVGRSSQCTAEDIDCRIADIKETGTISDDHFGQETLQHDTHGNGYPLASQNICVSDINADTVDAKNDELSDVRNDDSALLEKSPKEKVRITYLFSFVQALC